MAAAAKEKTDGIAKPQALVERNIDDLIPYVNNAKKHKPEQIDQIAASIKEFGFNNPILLDGENGVIAGHGRLLAAKKLGMDTVPTIDLTHLSTAQRRAYILTDNRLAEVNSSWDLQIVAIELEGIQAEGLDFHITGFDDEHLVTGDDDAPDLDLENPGDSYEETHSIIVVCADADEQELLYNRLSKMGLTLKVVSN